MCEKKERHHGSAEHRIIMAFAVILMMLCSLLPAHGYVLASDTPSQYICGHVHDKACGYSQSMLGGTCSHCCNIIGFDNHTPGKAIDTFDAKAGETFNEICEELPKTLKGKVACAKGDVDIPVDWICDNFDGKAGKYAFYAKLSNEHCTYNVEDDSLTENVDERELPFITVTVPEATMSALTNNGYMIYNDRNILSSVFLSSGTGGQTITFDLAYGSVQIGSTYSGKDSSGNDVTGSHDNNNKYLITQSNSDTKTSNTITLVGNNTEPTYDVTINGINCNTDDENGSQKKGGIIANALADTPMNIILKLQGSNSVGRLHYATGEAQETSSSSLKITSASGDGSLEGSLTAYSSSPWSAAIGGIDDTTQEASRNITIEGGTIIATTHGYEYTGTSAIGGGGNGYADVTITGGNVTALNCGTGATIGGGGGKGLGGGGGYVIISGGTVAATNNYATGVAIGGGGSVDSIGSIANVNITGGTVTATGSIGGGYSQDNNGGTATVNISGGKVTTTGSIGGGNSVSASGGLAHITISGGTISAANISGGHGFGGTHAGGTLSVIGGSARVDHVCPAIKTTGVDDSTPLTYNVYVLNGADPVPNAEVTAFTVTPPLDDEITYGLNDVYTDDDGRLYLWLPANKEVTNVTLMIDSVPTVCTTSSTQAAAYITPVPPAESGGYIDFGQVLTANLSGETIAGEYSWQKLSNGSWAAISGATGGTFTPTVNDVGEIRVVINDIYISSSVFILPPTIDVTVPMKMDVTVDAMGNFTVGDSGNQVITNNSTVPVYITDVSYAWITEGEPNAEPNANEIFHDYTAVNAQLMLLNNEIYSFSGAAPNIAHPSAEGGIIAAKNGDMPGILHLGWAFTLGNGNHINLVAAGEEGVQVATVTYTIEYIPPIP